MDPNKQNQLADAIFAVLDATRAEVMERTYLLDGRGGATEESVAEVDAVKAAALQRVWDLVFDLPALFEVEQVPA